ncbi:MAG TPA: metallophosphoesterase [Caldilineaceae bacterium]|nr:metallophosphoesterase [Caldilineaceae bacterium]
MMTNLIDHTTDLTFLHLTDLHLTAAPDLLVNSRSPAQKLATLLSRIHELEIRPAFVLISGDLVNGGTLDEYQFLQTELGQLEQLGVPILLALGNHDARRPFRQVILGEAPNNLSAPYYHSTVIDGLNVIVLDSHLPGEVSGYIDAEQLAWLDAELAKPMTLGHLVALHHPPVPATVRLLDSLGLNNADALAAVVCRHPNVLGVLSGHIHYHHVAAFANTISYTTPAVIYTIDPGVTDNLRILDGSGFSIGTVHNGQLLMNTVMLPGAQEELAYRVITEADLAG